MLSSKQSKHFPSCLRKMISRSSLSSWCASSWLTRNTTGTGDEEDASPETPFPFPSPVWSVPFEEAVTTAGEEDTFVVDIFCKENDGVFPQSSSDEMTQTQLSSMTTRHKQKMEEEENVKEERILR